MQVGEILLLEHFPPVYTFGLRQKDYTTHAERLRSLGAEVHKVYSLFMSYTPIGDMISGPKGRIDHVSWSWTAGLLPHPQPQSTKGTSSTTVNLLVILPAFLVECISTLMSCVFPVGTILIAWSEGICSLFRAGSHHNMCRLWSACTDDQVYWSMGGQREDWFFG